MIMKSRTLTVVVVALAGIASGAVLVKSVSFSGTTNAGYSSTARPATASPATASPAPQASGEYVFACVNKSGKIDYLEFRAPLPHQCWFAGETLWHFAALPAVIPSPTPTPTPTLTPAVSAPVAPASASSSPSASSSSSSSSSATATSQPGS
jgi:hypothetical protein